MIRVICSKCKMPANLPDSAAGKVAVCKCGQKNPIPKPGGPPAAQPAAQPVAPAAPAAPVAPQAPAPAALVVDVAANAGVTDDLALQELNQDTGAKEAPPEPCPACQKPLPAGEIVCQNCGYVAQEGAMKKDKRIINKPRPMSWGGKHASQLTAVDFLKMAGSAQVISSMVMLILRTVLVFLLVIFVSIGLGILVGMVAFKLPPIGQLLLKVAYVLFIGSLFWGTIMKEPFAVCQAACFGYDAPRTNDWSTLKTGFMFILISWLPDIAGFLTFYSTDNVGAALAVFWFTALFIVPMTLLSVAQSGGEWSGFNPVRIFTWLGRLILPYLGVAGVIFGEITLIIGLGILVGNMIGFEFWTTQGIDWAQLGMLAGVFTVVMVLLLHPFVYGAAMLGMLYRKYERQLMG